MRLRRHKIPGQHSTRQSISYYSRSSPQKDVRAKAPADYFEQLETSMLIQDVAAGIVPIGGRTENKSFNVALVPFDTKVEELIEAAISRNDYSHNLADAVCDFIHDCSQIILSYKDAPYEIVYCTNKEDGKVVGFKLVPIQPRTVLWQHGKLVQYVPPDVAQERKVSQYIPLPLERVLIFKQPSNVEDKVHRMMEELASLSGSMFPDFTLPAAGNDPKSFRYDVKEIIRARMLAIASAGKPIGWNARGTFGEEVLEYYELYRRLLFEQFKIELRNSVLSTLNEGLERAGHELGFSGHIEMNGLPTLEDVKLAQAQLEGGKRPFNEIFAPFLRN